MKGASAMYSYHIAPDKGLVTILSPAPTNNIVYVKSSSFINTYYMHVCSFNPAKHVSLVYWSNCGAKQGQDFQNRI